MFDLNDIWRDYDLKASQSPSQWRNKAKEHLVLSEKLQIRKGQGGRNCATLATLEALFDLNDIYRKFRLKGRKQPHDWTNKVKEKLFESGNLCVQRAGRRGQFTWATLEAL